MSDFPIQQNKQCGSYAAWFVLNRVRGTTMTPKLVEETMSWKVPFAGTWPWGIKTYLTKNGLIVRMRNLRGKTTQEKQIWITDSIKDDRLLILLGRQNHQQHYVVVFGYDVTTDQYQIYDPLFGKVEWSLNQVLTFWSGGGRLGLFHWYAIEVS